VDPLSLAAITRDIFCSFDAYGCPFQESVESRLLLYPVDGFSLTCAQFDALSHMMEQTGEAYAICSMTEGLVNVSDIVNSESRAIARGDYDSYSEWGTVKPGWILSFVENVIISSGGHWGLVVSQDKHALLGGRRSAIEEFKEVYTGWRDDAAAWIRDWESVSKTWDISFVKRVLQGCRE